MDTLLRNGCLMVCSILFLGLLTSCSGSQKAGSCFQLYILGSDLDELELGNDPDQAWGVLAQVDLGASTWVIDQDDIETYNWSEQSITLTQNASSRLVQHLSEWSYLPIALSHRGFVATIDGDKLYGGVFLEAGSPMAIPWPVIYPDVSGETVVLRLRPAHPLSARYQDLDPSARSVIEIERVRDFFRRRGKLIE